MSKSEINELFVFLFDCDYCVREILRQINSYLLLTTNHRREPIKKFSKPLVAQCFLSQREGVTFSFSRHYLFTIHCV